MKLIADCLGGLLEGPGRSLARVMAAHDLRHFALIGRCIALTALATTLLVGVIAWETQTALAAGVWAAVLPLNLGAASLMGDMAAELGGTCAGYALVVPGVSAAATPTHG